MAKSESSTNGQLTGKELAALKAAVTKFGDPTRAARALDVPRAIVTSALSGATLRAGSLLLIRTRLAAESS